MRLVAARIRGRRPAETTSTRGTLIFGWYGKETVGDRAILASILQSIPPAAGPVLLAASDVAFSRRSLSTIGAPAVEVIDASTASFLQALDRVHTVILGGGPLMESHDMIDWHARLWYARRRGCRIMIYGCGVGPLWTSRRTRFVRRILALADVITVRDEASRVAAVCLGLAAHRILRTADPAHGFCLDPIRTDAAGTPPRLGLALRHLRPSAFPPGTSREHIDAVRTRYVNALTHAITLLQQQSPLDITLIPMQTHPDDDDRVFLAALARHLPRAPAIIDRDICESPARLIAAMADLDLIVASRFHALLFGLIAGTSLVAIDFNAPSGKVSALMGEAGLSAAVASLETLTGDSLHAQITDALTTRPAMRPRLAAARLEMRQREAENGRQLRQLLAADADAAPAAATGTPADLRA